MGSIYPGKDWAKGFNFMIRKDTETNILLMLVIGWNSDQTKMKAAGFNVKRESIFHHRIECNLAIHLCSTNVK